jgi:chromosome segregation ATPase
MPDDPPMADGPRSPDDRRDWNGRPIPDPTILTTEQLLRAIKGERDFVEGQLDVLRERLAGVDRATELRLTDIVKIPDQIDEKVSNLAAVTEERFQSIAKQFAERDTRSERESRDNKVAVDAAFAAQKESAAKQDESNQKAIDKSEVATAEKINKLAELFTTTTDALGDKIDDLKERVGKAEGSKAGATESRTGLYAAIGTITGVLVLGMIILGFIVSKGP